MFLSQGRPSVEKIYSGHGDVALEIQLLRDITDPSTAGPVNLAFKTNGADERTKQDGLSGTIRPNHRQRTSLWDTEAQVRQYLAVAKLDREIVNFQDILHVAMFHLSSAVRNAAWESPIDFPSGQIISQIKQVSGLTFPIMG